MFDVENRIKGILFLREYILRMIYVRNNLFVKNNLSF